MAPGAFEIVKQRRLAMRRRFGKAHVARNDCLVDRVAHVGAHVRDHLAGQAIAGIVHGQNDAVDRQAGVERAAHLFDGGQELRQAFEEPVLGLQRDDDRVGGGERVDREQVQRRGTVDQDIGDGLGIVGSRSAVAAQRAAQLIGAVVVAGDFKLDPKKVHGRRGDEEARHRGRNDHLAQGFFADQHLVARGHARAAVDAEPGRGVALGIEIDDEDPLADGRQRRSEVDGCRRLADAALLVRHRENARPRPGSGSRTRGSVSVSAIGFRPQLWRMRRILAFGSTALGSGSIA